MKKFTIKDAGFRLNEIINLASNTSETVVIEGYHNQVVLISEKDWRVINELITQLALSRKEAIQRTSSTVSEEIAEEIDFDL